jgi:hypothetical protein
VKYESKEALVGDIEREYAALIGMLDGIPARRLVEPGVWGEGWTVRDLVAHLYEWQRMFLGWYEAGAHGAAAVMPAPGYTWRETPRLNRDIQLRHARTAPAEVRREFDSTHGRILALARRLTPQQLLEPGQYTWTGRSALVTYLGANTSSHYRFAQKVLRRWLRRS